MTRALIPLLAALLFSPALSATNITIGEPLPALTINERGELLLANDEFSFRPWSFSGAIGKVHVVQYMAARQGARDQTIPFTDRLESALPENSYHVTTVLNMDDALWGTTGFVMSSVKSSKKKYPDSTIVLDENGVGLETYGLQPKGATIVIMDGGGSVLYVKEGAMTAEEIDSTLELMRQHIPAAD